MLQYRNVSTCVLVQRGTVVSHLNFSVSLCDQAMRVHPDKHGGKEQAGDAFKLLQNAYEVRMGRWKRTPSTHAYMCM